ncbi:MAG: ester cyclase [Chloroflexota bacterium]|nr:ester cyclase [Chloroflexota bacterium]
MRPLRLTPFILTCVIAVLMAVTFASAQDATPGVSPQEEAQRELLYRIVEDGLTIGDFDLVRELIAEDFVVHSPVGDLDREGFVGFMQALRASLSDFTVTRDAVIVEGEYAATRATISGTFDGADFASPMGTLPPNGEVVTIVLQTFHQFDDEGRIVEEWAMFDLLSFFTQLGAMPAPSS